MALLEGRRRLRSRVIVVGTEEIGVAGRTAVVRVPNLFGNAAGQIGRPGILLVIGQLGIFCAPDNPELGRAIGEREVRAVDVSNRGDASSADHGSLEIRCRAIHRGRASGAASGVDAR